MYVQEGYKVTIVIDQNESSENTPDVDGNAYFVYRTDDGGFVECKDTDPAPYKTDYNLMPDLVKQTALASDDSGLLKLDVEIEKILRGEEATETTTETPAETTTPAETSDTESSTETSDISETTPETTTAFEETTAPESSVVTQLPAVTTEPPVTVPPETTVPQEAAPPQSETTVPSVTTAPPETLTTTETTTTTTAEPEPEVATVLFADRSGNIVEQKEVEVGESIGALPAVPTVAGHTGKWTVDGEEISAEYVVMGDVTALAVYTANKYTVTFETKETGVDMPEAQTVEYGSPLALPQMPEKTGYTGKWTIDGEEIPEDFEVTSDITVKFEYVINTYEITFECDDKTLTMPDPITAEYGTKLSEALADVEMPEKPWYNGKWTVDGADITADKLVEDDVIVTAEYTHIKVSISVDYVGGYSDGGDNDPANFGLYTSEDGSLDYDITIEELQSEIDVWIDSVSRNNNYVAGKVVYDNTDTSFDVLANPLEIDSLPEITADAKFSDIVYDYEYDGVYCSFVRIYLVPDWTVHTVTFHDVDGTIFEQFNVYDNQFIDIPDVPSSAPDATWVYLNQYGSYRTLALDNGVYEVVDAYCGYMVESHGYSNGGWNDPGPSIYIKAGDTLTDEDLKNLCSDNVIAGFIDTPVSNSSQITGFYTAGQEVNGNIDLYIVKAYVEYEKATGETGTLYWLGDGSLLDELDTLRSSPNNVWHFDSADGDELNDETLGNRMNYDYDNPPDDPQTAARFKVVETAL